MLSSDFIDIFSRLPNIKSEYKGTFSADKLPKKLKQHNFAIINTDLSSGPGIHWYVMFKYSSSSLEVFDSLGIDSIKRNFLDENVQLSSIKEIEFNTNQFQKDNTDSCGKFTVYFIVNRLYNLDQTFKQTLAELFVENLEANEERVEAFYQDLLKLEYE